MGQRAAAHEGQRRDLDLAVGHAADHLVGRHHVVQRVVERAQIGIDLLLHVAGQEAEPLAGLDRRAGQHDAVDLAGLQHRDRLGDREIGLAGAGRADAEHHLVRGQRLHVGGLAGAARPDRAAPGADRRQVRQRQARIVLGVGQPDRRLDLAAADASPRSSRRHSAVQRGLRRLDPRRVAGDRDAVAAAGQPHAQRLLDPDQMPVVVAEQQRQQRVVVELQGDGLAGGWRRGEEVRSERGDVGQAQARSCDQGFRDSELGWRGGDLHRRLGADQVRGAGRHAPAAERASVRRSGQGGGRGR